jgi:hypothetical protein
VHCLLIACAGLNDEKTSEATPSRLIVLSNDRNRTLHYCHPVVRSRDDWNHSKKMVGIDRLPKPNDFCLRCQVLLTLVGVGMVSVVTQYARSKLNRQIAGQQHEQDWGKRIPERF